MNEKDIYNALLKKVHKANDGKKSIDCAEAFNFAIENSISLEELAKITKCQLGCF